MERPFIILHHCIVAASSASRSFVPESLTSIGFFPASVQESISEDPHLNGMYSASLLQGFQGDDPTHLGVAATCKHFLAYSLEGGPAAEGFSVSRKNCVYTYNTFQLFTSDQFG